MIPQGFGVLATPSMINATMQEIEQKAIKEAKSKESLEIIAKKLNTTRSAAAVEHWKEGMSNSILVVGYAPTALFRVLEIINEYNIKPSLVIGMPLGFVGAVEAKEELINFYQSTGLNIITIRGRRGGSAMASATINAISLLIDDK